MSGRISLRAAGAGLGIGSLGWLSRVAGPDTWIGENWPWFVVAGGVLVVAVLVSMLRVHPLARFVVVSAAVLGVGVWFAVGDLPVAFPGRAYWPWLVGVGGLLLLRSVASWWHHQVGSAGRVNRWSSRARRNDGVASFWAVLRTSSWLAARRRATVVRPSLRELSFVRRLFVPTREIATPLARVGLQRIWSPIEDVTVRIGGPRTGKTGELAGRILDAPGAVIATSTRTDLIELTGPCRSARGPLHVFNPSGLGGLKSTITFDPLSGCTDPATATSRATDLISAVSAPGKDGDREFWVGQARRVLAALLHAAALGDGSMRDVLAWVADPDTAELEVSRFLRRSPEPAWEQDAVQFLRTNDRTRSSICATIMPALGWLTDATAAAAAVEGGFNVEQLLAERGTVYMLGAEDAQVAPLVTALTGHIARQARRIASFQPGGRLDPPLTLALDEAALICPIPLDSWTADMGGRNVTIHIAAQSRAQLRQRWGDTGAAAILNNAATLLIYGGTRDHDDLTAYSTLTGERDEKVETLGVDGDVHTRTMRRVPVLSPGQIAQLPARRVLIIRRGMAPAIGVVQMAWKRRDVKAARRARRLAALEQQWQERLIRWGIARDHAYLRVVTALESVDGRIRPLLGRVAARFSARRSPVREPRALPPARGANDDSVETSGAAGGEQR